MTETDSRTARPGPAVVASGQEGADFLRIEGISKRFGGEGVLRDIDLSVRRGEVFALLGPSGSGKSTLLRVLAGFESADSGRILVEGEDVARLSPARRGFGMVFQSYALFPHLTVAKNVAFGLETAGLHRDALRERVHEMLCLVDLVGLEERRIGEISGGQQQRVALARALALSPRVLMLDEPLSNLDPALRERTRVQLGETVRRIGITTVLVTHEQEEAFELGDRVGVLHDGVLAQVDPPTALYRRPWTRFVASFIGRATFLPATVESVEQVEVGESAETVAAGDVLSVRLDGYPGQAWRAEVSRGCRLAPGDPVDLMVRPEQLCWRRAEPPSVAAGSDLGPAIESSPPGEIETALRGEIVGVRFTGPILYATVALESYSSDVPRQVEVALSEPPVLGERGEVLLLAEVRSGLRFAPRAFPRAPSA
jgi:ABC-type Fe3+/spermidine/putrescine transport system ATPase subunit